MDKAQLQATLQTIDIWLLIFGIIVVIGVGGESIFGFRHWWNSRKLQAIQEGEERQREETIANLNKESGAFQLQIAQANERAAKAELELLRLQNKLDFQGPRAPFIENAAPELVKALLPFAGQKVALYVCTSAELRAQEGEMMDTWGRIADVLGDKGAKWSMPHNNLMFWKQEFSCNGIQVGSSSRSPQRTRDAAKVLSDELFKILPPSTDNMSGTVDSDFVLDTLKRGLERGDAPWVLEAKEPDLIAVMIGRHPLRSVAKQNKIHDNVPK
jgi:hypothetical protein